MRFVPKLPRDGINVSRDHPLKEATILVLGVGAALALIFAVLIALGGIVMLLLALANA